ANFIQYVDEGFYAGTTFHRVIANFMVQGGGHLANLDRKPTRAPIEIESRNGLKNDAGWVAMARTAAPNSASSQFFINVVNNDGLIKQTAAHETQAEVLGLLAQACLNGLQGLGKTPCTPMGPGLVNSLHRKHGLAHQGPRYRIKRLGTQGIQGRC
ncbi:MAG: hypothetical protein EBW58_13255, partial [Betaproteobacteria bacterium]|nr:hypothetical protein [Betaproteobacteria bacterium]